MEQQEKIFDCDVWVLSEVCYAGVSVKPKNKKEAIEKIKKHGWDDYMEQIVEDTKEILEVNVYD